ncbi:hypothetical protein HN011_010649 [Eciton burchellii]|nr:hypothetical protein HN011_010649 [Eciton burchellii]
MQRKSMNISEEKTVSSGRLVTTRSIEPVLEEVWISSYEFPKDFRYLLFSLLSVSRSRRATRLSVLRDDTSRTQLSYQTRTTSANTLDDANGFNLRYTMITITIMLRNNANDDSSSKIRPYTI